MNKYKSKSLHTLILILTLTIFSCTNQEVNNNTALEESKKSVYEITKQFGSKKVNIDTSQAHSIDKDWKYGFPELNINQTLSESYFTHNMKVDIKLDNTISYSIELMNIFNTEYADILGAIMPKRWLIVGVKFNLDSN